MGSLLMASALSLVVGCQILPDAEPEPLFFPRGEIRPDEQWPARGSLVDDRDLVIEVTQVVDQWQTPEGVGRHDSPVFTSLVWLGEVDGTVLAVVAFAPEDEYSDTWVLEVTGERGDLAVTQASDFRAMVTNFIEDTEVLPIRSPQVGPRYLISEFIAQIAVDGQVVEVVDGLTRLEGVDTCAGAQPGGWLDSLREVQSPDHPQRRWGSETSQPSMMASCRGRSATSTPSRPESPIARLWRCGDQRPVHPCCPMPRSGGIRPSGRSCFHSTCRSSRWRCSCIRAPSRRTER